MLAAAIALRGFAAGDDAEALNETALAFAVFLVPHTIVSLFAGVLADRFGLRRVLVWGKSAEWWIVAIAGHATLTAARVSPNEALAVLALLGVRSGLIAPAREGLLPDLLTHRQLSWGNGRLVGWTFLAIVAGTAFGSAAPAFLGQWLFWSTVVFVMAGTYAAYSVPVQPPNDPAAGPRALLDGIRIVLHDRALGLVLLGTVMFWFTASLLGHNVATYARISAEAGTTWRSLPLAALALGVAAGALLAGRWSRNEIEVGLVPLGGLGIAALTGLLALLSPGVVLTLSLLFATGVACGAMVVPLSALAQWRAPVARRATVLGLVSATSGTAILAGSFGAWALSHYGVGVRGVLATAALVALAGAMWGAWLMPASLVRGLVVVLTRTLYRMRVVGRANVPDEGGVLLTPNHVSFMDGLFVIAAIDRPVKFLIHDSYFNNPMLSPFMRAIGGIPVSSSRSKEQIDDALAAAGEALDDGRVVCVFPEGQITRTGTMHQFRRGIERIARGRDAAIVPVFLDRVWGSLFSRAGGRFLFKLPERMPYPVTVMYGAPLSADTDANEVRAAVQQLGSSAWRHRRPDARPLHHAFLRAARRAPFRTALGDAAGARWSRLGTLTRAVALARSLRGTWGAAPRVGCLLPPGRDAAIVQLAAAFAGREFVPLDPAGGPAGIARAAEIASIRTVVTTDEALRSFKLTLPDGMRALSPEEHRAGLLGRFSALVLALLAPPDVLDRACGTGEDPDIDDVASVVFTSGRTGTPKAVLLSHFNLDSNREGLAQVLRPRARDGVVVTLPHWGAFGHLAVWFGVTHGDGVALPDGADAAGRTIERHHASVLFATPDQLASYVESAKPEQFGSLRGVVTATAALSGELRDAFEDRFGIEPLESYGMTECSPIVAIGAPDFRARGFFQPGTRLGFVGQPLPGVAVRIVDPATHEERPAGEEGTILVRGPNVMIGYAGGADAPCLPGGWFVTGDTGAVDADGFLRVRGCVGST